ncbi:MAG TPA: alpha/beta hydrolase [Candidatus Wallbacteria bacterium]|nr:alpha/beta hydrolase [Candidatus Wallbacteria bacterium]
MNDKLKKRIKMDILLFTGAYVLVLIILIANLNNIIFLPQKAVNEEMTPKSMGFQYEEIFVDTVDGDKLCCWYIPYPAGVSDLTIVYSHGNAENISRALPHAAVLSKALKANLFLYDYRGYCKSTGRSSTDVFYADADLVFKYISERPDQITNKFIVYGRSLGGAAAIHMASKYNIRAVISESTFASLPLHAWYNKALFVFYPFVPDRLPSLRKSEDIKSPWLMIHGDGDRTIDFRNCGELYNSKSKAFKEKYIVAGARHNNVYSSAPGAYLKAIEEFMRKVE